MRVSLSAGLLALSSGAAAAVGDKVKTSSGDIEGHASSWKPEVSEYLGIPFAQPPIDELRWEAPVAFRSDKNFVAAKFSPSCPANVRKGLKLSSADSTAINILGAITQAGDTFSEDCLTLNVWSKPQSGEKKKAVLVWIYGGGFTSGNSANPAYNGARLADENDVVVVSLNYRLNIFGFPGVDFIPERNLGLLDQRLAIEWVRDNIAAFGGDAKRIVLAGEQADYHAYAWNNDPIVSGYIAQSGTATSSSAGYNNADAWFKVSEKLGCGAENATSLTVSCLKSKRAIDILDAVKATTTRTSLGVGEFAPTIDDRIIFSDISSRRTNGLFARKPLLVGSSNNEAALFTILDGLAAASNLTAPAPKAAKGGLGGALSGIRNNPSLVNGQFTCPAADAAKARRDNGVLAWRYRYKGEWPNTNIGPESGAYHGSEIGLVFGTTEYLSKKADLAEEAILGEKIRRAWTAFIKNPAKGLVGNDTNDPKAVNWPVYNAQGNTLISLGGNNSSSIDFLPSTENDRQCGLVRLVGGGKSGGGLGGFNLGDLAGLLGGGGFGGFGGAAKGTNSTGAKGAKGGAKGGKTGKGTGTGGFNFGNLFGGAKGTNSTRTGGGAKGTNSTRTGTGTGGGKGFSFPKSNNGTRTTGGGGKGFSFPKSNNGTRTTGGGGGLGGLLGGLFGGGGFGGFSLGGRTAETWREEDRENAPKETPTPLRPRMVRRVL